MVGLPDGAKKFEDMCNRLDRIPACDRQTDRQISHCNKKLACLLFDVGVIKTTDDDCEQQLPSVDNTGGETTVCSVDNSCGLTPKSNRMPY